MIKRWPKQQSRPLPPETPPHFIEPWNRRPLIMIWIFQQKHPRLCLRLYVKHKQDHTKEKTLRKIQEDQAEQAWIRTPVRCREKKEMVKEIPLVVEEGSKSEHPREQVGKKERWRSEERRVGKECGCWWWGGQ